MISLCLTVTGWPGCVETRPTRNGKLAVKSKKQHWTFTKDFEITRDRANQLNKTAVIEHHTNWGLWISLGLLVILLLLIAWYIHRKQLKIKRLEERLKDKS
ncbi:DUF3324 domain-containing protein, partial [Lactiplantibacillus plantarum]|nr:DUF3324 domain-containing protein [Lactiplantibacillus plantarum]